MKYLLVVFTLFLTVNLSLKAQKSELYLETVYLKNGSIISGDLIEQIPGKSVKIQTRDGNIFAYELDEVDRITRKRIEKSTFDGGPQIGYKGFVDLGYSFGVGDYGADRIEFSTSHGYQFNPYIYAGVGAGLNYFTDAEVFSVPIFANSRLTLPTNSFVSPFVDFKIGYTVSRDVKGFYFAPSLGARFDVGENNAVNFSVGYTLQNVKIDYYYYGSYYGSYYDSEHKNCGAITLKLGFEF